MISNPSNSISVRLSLMVRIGAGDGCGGDHGKRCSGAGHKCGRRQKRPCAASSRCRPVADDGPCVSFPPKLATFSMRWKTTLEVMKQSAVGSGAFSG